MAAGMPLLCDVVPAALELAHLVDAAGGLDAAAWLLGCEPEQVVGWLTSEPAPAMRLATCRLARSLGERAGWSTPMPGLRAVA